MLVVLNETKGRNLSDHVWSLFNIIISLRSMWTRIKGPIHEISGPDKIQFAFILSKT